MNFEDEPYFRLYQRDTKTWLRWRWEGQVVFTLTSRKLDRAGVIDDVTDPVADVSLITGLPEEIVAVGLERVLASGTFELRGSRLVAPRYVEAQTAIKTDRLRSKELRKRRRDMARAGLLGDEVEPLEAANDCDTEADGSVTPPPPAVLAPSPGVAPASRSITQRPETSRAVTPSLADPSLADLDQIPLEPPAQSVSTPEPMGRKRKPARAKTLCPADLQPDTTTLAEAWKCGFTVAARDRVVVEFIDYWRGRGDLRADWQATLRNRLRAKAEQLGLSERKPRDATWQAHQDAAAKANAPIKNPVKRADFDAKAGALFG
jgi:hypothetical protein